MTRFTQVAVVAVLLVLSVSARADDKEELGKLKGTWSLESRVSNGSEFKLAKALMIQVKIEGEQWTVSTKGKAGDTEKITIDSSKKPKTIDRIGKNVKQLGIYKIEGDTLTVAFGTPNGARPEKFEAPMGSNVFLSIYKRN